MYNGAVHKVFILNLDSSIHAVTFTFTFSHLADAFYPKRLTIGEYISDNLEEGKHTEEVPITLSLRHCSNKYKLAREGEKDKEKDEDFEKVKDFFFFFYVVK